MTMALTREQIVTADDSKTLAVNVPEWGGDVRLRVMTVGERDAYELEYQRKKNTGGLDDFRSKFLVRCICDDSGQRLFTDADVEKVSRKSAQVVNRLWEVAMKFNDLDESKIEDLAKN